MNAEYESAGKTTRFSVDADNGFPPPTAKLTERSTCGKWILERVLVLDSYDVQREVACYSLVGTGKRAV